LFDFFGGGHDEEELPQSPIYRSIDPNGRYRSVCVRLCDGFYYPIHYATYGSLLAQDAAQCQSNCAAPAELYVYRNPGQEIEQAVSLSGSAYMDLPVALRFRKEYVNGCSCKQAEYNPTEIEAANKRAEADGQPVKGTGKGNATVAAPPPPQAPPPQAAAPASADDQQVILDLNGNNASTPEEATAAIPQVETAPAPPEAVPPVAPPPASASIEETPAPPPPAAVPPPKKPPAPPAAAAPAPTPPPPAAAAAETPPTPAPAQSTAVKRKPATQPASPFGPQ
jgi:hypothetical protein